MRPGTSMTRFVIVMAATMAAIVGVALAFADTQPLLALGLTLVILAISSAVLPSRTWIKFTDFCRWVARRGRGRQPAVAAEDPEDAAQRKSFGLDRAEYDSRIQIGMPLGHLERLAYTLPNPEEWDEREAEIWPDGEWTEVVDEVRREEGWQQ